MAYRSSMTGRDMPVIEDDDEGFASTKWKPSAKNGGSRSSLMNGKAVRNKKEQPLPANHIVLDDFRVESKDDYGYDPDSDNPLRRAEVEELHEIAYQKSQEVTDSIRNVRKITEDTKAVASQTLVNLKQQGDQIQRTHEKAVRLEQELKKGEYMLNKLGPIFSLGWKVKKGHNITGPKMLPDDTEGNSEPLEERGKHRAGLFGTRNKDVKATKPVQQEPLTGMARLEADKKLQDEGLEDVSQAIGQLKDMALQMNNEMDKQDAQLDDLSKDVNELGGRVQQSNTRQRRLLGYRR